MRTRRLLKLPILFALLAVVFVQCDQFSLYDQFELESRENQAAPLAIAPVAATLSSDASLTFTATGGSPPYSYSIVSGSGTIDAESGTYSAPSAAGTDFVRVTDAAGETNDAAVAVTALPGFGIIPSSVSLAANGTITFSGTGGTDPYTYSLVSGAGSIDPDTGVYSAGPTSGSATVRATDSSSPPETADASITVSPASSLSISPSSIELGTGGSVDFNAYGGVEPYAFSIVSGSGSVDPTTGEYEAPSVADSVTVRVTDSDSPPSTDDATLSVNAPPPASLAISPTSISLFTNSTADFDATGGVPPYTFSLAAGAGSVAEGTGVFTAPSTGTTSTVRVTDSATPPAQADATATVYEPLGIVPESTSLSVGSSFDFSATGGKTPYTFSVASGVGSITSSTGVYSAPTGPGNAVVRVTDDLGNTREAAVSVTAVGPLVISPSSTTLLEGASVTFTASGGASPYTFSVLAPAAGSIDSATGEYTAPGFSATDTIRVVDALGNTSDATATVVADGPLSISPDAATVAVNGQKVFSASGGAPPYSFAVVSGPGSINASTGVYSAPDSTATVTVRVTDSLHNTDDATVTVAGSGCGLDFSESEPNDDTGPPWHEANDFGITLVPGCSMTITGVTDLDGDSDVFEFEKGSANVVTFIAIWDTGDNELDFQLYTHSGDEVAESSGSNADSESLTWTVGAGGPPSRYLEVEVKGDGGVSYTLIISAN